MNPNWPRYTTKDPCPICGKASTQQDHPFCSPRCADIDLNRWLAGRYVIPAESVEDSEDEDALAPGAGDEEDEV